MSERIGVQAAPVNFDAEQFLQTDVTQLDVPSNDSAGQIQLVRGFEHDGVEPERMDKPVCVGRIQVSILIEESDSVRSLASTRGCSAPASSLPAPGQSTGEGPVAEPPSCFFLLHPRHRGRGSVRRRHHVIEMALRETLTPAFD